MTTLTDGSTELDRSSDPRPAAARQHRGWAAAGIGAASAAIAGLVGSSGMSAVYDVTLDGNAVAIADKMSTQVPQILVFHVMTMITVLLLPIFAAGLARHLEARTPVGSLLPRIASSGLLLVAVAGLMGTALDTEFMFALADRTAVSPESAVIFGHWVGTVPWVWVGAGMTALAVGIAGRRYGAVSRSLGWTSLVLGGLTVLFGLSPVQYMSAMVGPIWLLTASIALFRGLRRSI